MSDIFKAPSAEYTAQQMADSLPTGRAWGLRNVGESNVRKLINALSVAFNLTQQQIELLNDEFQIGQTFDLLEDWETSVGIPGQCLGTSETIAQRRQAVIDRLGKMPIVILGQMQAYVDALFPGIGVTLYPGYEYYGFEYDFEVPFLGDISSRWLLVAAVPLSDESFEYEFEMTFEGGVDTEQLECLLNKINPAPVYVIIEYVG